MRKKRSVTLIELMIGCALLSVLLAFVFGLMREVKDGQRLIQKEREGLYARIHLESRLDQLLLKAVSLGPENPGFYVDSEGGLIFISKIGVSYDPPFLDRTLCRIYRSPEGELILDQWPDPIRHGTAPEEMRRETLARGLETLTWSFFSPPISGLRVQGAEVKGNEEEQDPPAGEWVPTWKVGYKKIPPLLRMHFSSGGKPEIYETYLPSTHFPLELPK